MGKYHVTEIKYILTKTCDIYPLSTEVNYTQTLGFKCSHVTEFW